MSDRTQERAALWLAEYLCELELPQTERPRCNMAQSENHTDRDDERYQNRLQPLRTHTLNALVIW